MQRQKCTLTVTSELNDLKCTLSNLVTSDVRGAANHERELRVVTHSDQRAHKYHWVRFLTETCEAVKDHALRYKRDWSMVWIWMVFIRNPVDAQSSDNETKKMVIHHRQSILIQLHINSFLRDER